MITRFFKDYNKLFADELNKNTQITRLIGKIKPVDIHLLHNVIQYTWVRLLYEHFPTILNFGKYFYVFTKRQELLDKFDINKYIKPRRKKKLKTKESEAFGKKWSTHIDRLN